MRRHRGVLRGRVPALRLVPAYRHARPDPGEGCTRARAHAQHTHWPRSVLWQMLVSGLRGGVLPGLGVTVAWPGPLLDAHVYGAGSAAAPRPLPCPPTAAGLHSVSRLVHTQPVHKMRRGAGETPPWLG